MLTMSPDLHSLILMNKVLAHWASISSHMSVWVIDRNRHEVTKQIDVYLILLILVLIVCVLRLCLVFIARLFPQIP